MKITHICLCGPYTDNWTYQENLLPKYHKKLGYEVSVVASEFMLDKKGQVVSDNRETYTNEDLIKVTRLKMKAGYLNRYLRRYSDLYTIIEKEQADILFIHGIQFLDSTKLIKYIKNNKHIKVYVDNHADFLNSAKNWVSKHILHRLIWRYCAQALEPFTDVFYGVLPARVDFLLSMYGLPKEKVKLLVMGADDEMVEQARDPLKRKAVRDHFQLNNNNFIMLTGGKIDRNKRETLLLMEAFKELDYTHVKLFIFGSISEDIREEFESLLNENILYIGWLDSNSTYECFHAADLVIFPSLHSVYWEQAVGTGKPTVFKYLEGFTHVDVGGNCEFIRGNTKEDIMQVLSKIIENPAVYKSMLRAAETIGMDVFSYCNIAKLSLAETIEVKNAMCCVGSDLKN